MEVFCVPGPLTCFKRDGFKDGIEQFDFKTSCRLWFLLWNSYAVKIVVTGFF